MAATTNLGFNVVNNTAWIEFYSGAMLVSRFDLANGIFTLSARPNQVTVSYSDLISWLNDVLFWIKECQDRLSVGGGVVSDYKIDAKKVAGEDRISVEIDSNNFDLIHPGSDVILKPRAQLQFNFLELKTFIHIHRWWLYEIILKQW